MKKQQFIKKVTLISIVTIMTTLLQAQAVNMAEASGTLAGIAVMAVQAKANLANAASSGDIDAIADAIKRADAVDSAMASAQEAYSKMERASAGNDEDAATAAADDLEVARQNAFDALNGEVPEPTPQSKHDQWKEGQKNTGGGPGRAYDPPNIYDVPWQTEGLRGFYQGLFGNFWGASSHGGGHQYHGGHEYDATPE